MAQPKVFQAWYRPNEHPRKIRGQQKSVNVIVDIDRKKHVFDTAFYDYANDQWVNFNRELDREFDQLKFLWMYP